MKKLFFGILLVLLLANCKSAPAVESEDYAGFFASELTTFNYLVCNSPAAMQAAAISVEALARANRFGVVEPALARGWRSSANDTVWEITLNRNIVWYTNEGERFAEITACDFVAAFEFITDPANGSAHFDLISKYVLTVESRGNAIIYTLSQPTPYFPSLLTTAAFLPVNGDFISHVGGRRFGTNPENMLYSGSHLMYSWSNGVAVFVKNQNYREAERVHVNKITLFSAPQNTPQPADAPYVYQTEPHGGASFFILNYGSSDSGVAAAFQNANFRKALFSAINRRALIGLLMHENQDSYITNTVNAPQTAFTPAERDYMRFGALPDRAGLQTYDPDEAAKLMAAAKEELGNSVTWPLVLILPRRITEFGFSESRLYQQMIESAFGGDVLVDFRLYTEDWEYEYYLSRGEFDLGIVRHAPAFGDPSSMLSAFLPNSLFDNLFNFSLLEETAVFAEMFSEAAAQTNVNARFTQFAEAELYLLETAAIVLPYRRDGGEYITGREIRPFDRPFAAYGLSQYLFIDRVFGAPLTLSERSALYGEYQQALGFIGR